METRKTLWGGVGAVLALIALLAVFALAPLAAWADDTYTWSGESGTLVRSTSDSGITITISGDGTLTLTADTTANVVISSGTVMIDLGGHTLTGLGTDSVVKSTDSTVTLKDGTVTGGNATNGGGLYVEDGSLTVEGVTVTNCEASYGGGVYVRSSSFTMTDSSITSCSAPRGGGICIRYGNDHTTTLTSSTISNCAASNHGAGVYLYGASSPTLVMEGGSITGCTAGDKGGAIRACTGSVVTLSGVELSGNKATNGGAIYTDGGSVTVSGGSITGNTATSTGGGAYLTTGDSSTAASLTATDGTLANNAATTAADDVYCASACTLSLSGMNSGVRLTDTGYTIVGWYEDASSSRYAYSSNITSAVTSTATGTEYYLIAAHGNVATVTYVDGVDDEVVFADVTVTDSIGAAVPVFTGSTERSGYYFLGWSTDGSTVFDLTSATIPTGGVTYYAVWQTVCDADGHTAGEAVIENEVAATCTEDGSYDSVVYCTVCGEELSRETVTAAATGHEWDYDNPSVTWADDYSSATVVWICLNDSSHTYTATDVVVTSVENEDGSNTYTALCTGPDGSAYEFAVTVAATAEEETIEEEVLVSTGDTALISVVACAAVGVTAVAAGVSKRRKRG